MPTSGPSFATSVAQLTALGGVGTWASTPNALGGDDNLLAVWTKPNDINTVSIWLELSGFGAFSDIPAGATVNSVTVRTNQYQASTSRMAAPLVELWDSATAQVGATQTGALTSITTNVDVFTFSGVTASLSTLRVRFRHRGNAANGQGSNASLDYVSLTVDYTAPVTAESVSLAATAFGVAADTAGATFAQAEVASLAAAAQDAAAAVVPPALPAAAALSAAAFDATVQLAVSVYDRVYHVATDGTDAGAGTQGQPLATIGEAVTRAAADNLAGRSVLVLINDGIYREWVVVPTGGTPSPLTIEASGPNATISGSDVSPAADWTVHDAPNRIWWRAWTQSWGVQPWPDAAWAARAATEGWTDVIRRREMVLVDGVWVRQVLTLAELTTYDAAYYVDEAADRLYVRLPTGAAIATALVEVGMRERCLEAYDRSNLTVRGLTFQHAVTLMQTSAVKIGGCDNLLIDNCRARLNSWGGMQLAESENNTGQRLTRVRVSDNGVLGLNALKTQNLVAEYCTNNRNNVYRGLWANFDSWEDGFKMLECRNVTFRHCRWRDNNSGGVWFDYDNQDVLVEDGVMSGNAFSGIALEYNGGPITFRRCDVYNNFRGLSTDGSANVTIDQCRFWDNNVEWNLFEDVPAPTVVPWDGRPTYTATLHDWTVTSCLFWTSVTGDDRLVDSLFGITDAQWTTFKATLVIDNNTYASPNASPFMIRTNTTSQSFATFAQWKTNLGGARDAASTFSALDPSPTPLLSVDDASVVSLAQSAAAFVRPAALTVTVVSDDRVDLSWGPVQAAGWYEVERDGVVIASDVVATSYSDIGLDPATLYSYRVRATRPGPG